MDVIDVEPGHMVISLYLLGAALSLVGLSYAYACEDYRRSFEIERAASIIVVSVFWFLAGVMVVVLLLLMASQHDSKRHKHPRP